MKYRVHRAAKRPAVLEALRGRLRTHKGAFLVALCMLALLPLALAPAGVLRLADLARLDRAQAMAEPFAARQLTAGDFYLLRQLSQRHVEDTLAPVPGSDFYVAPGYYPGNMTQDFTMGTYALQLMKELVENEILPQEWVDVITDIVPPGTYEYQTAFYYATDSLGFVDIHCYDPRYLDSYYCELFTLTVESRTGRVVRLWMGLPGDLKAPDPAQALPKWISYYGLDTLGDWADPETSIYGGRSLYSAAGGVLALCAAYPFQNYEDGSPCQALSLSLSMQDAPLCLDNDPAPDLTPAGYTLGELRPLSDPAGTEFSTGIGDADGYYEIIYTGSHAQLMYTPYTTMERAPLCSVPGCRHDTADCPAWLPYANWMYLHKAGDVLYLLHSTHYNAAELEKVQVEKEQMQYLLHERPWNDYERADWDRLCSAGEESYLEAVYPDRARERLATLPAEYFFYWGDDGALYGLTGPEYDSYNLHTDKADTFLRLDLATGEVTLTPLPNAQVLNATDDWNVPDVWKGQLVLCIRTYSEPYNPSSGQIFDAWNQTMQTHFVLYDPLTGASRRIWTDATGRWVNQSKVIGDRLYITRVDELDAQSVLTITGTTLYSHQIFAATLRDFANVGRPFGTFLPNAGDGQAYYAAYLRDGQQAVPRLVSLAEGDRSYREGVAPPTEPLQLPEGMTVPETLWLAATPDGRYLVEFFEVNGAESLYAIQRRRTLATLNDLVYGVPKWYTSSPSENWG